jgi:hypothetical protein
VVARLTRAIRVRGWIAAVVAAAALALLPAPGWLVDGVYGRHVYPVVQSVATAVTNVAPFAVLDALIIAAVLVVGFRAARLWTVARRSGVLTALWEAARRVVRGVAVVVVVFLGMWGCNYRRTPLARSLSGGAAEPQTTASLETAMAEVNALAVRVRPAMTAQPGLTYAEIARELPGPMDAALGELGQPRLARAGRPKVSFVLTPFFRRAGVNGMVDPVALESLVQPDLLPFERPFVLAHEWAHLAGRADEAEASAVGWLACMKGEPRLAYSASLFLITEIWGALPPAARRHAFAGLDAGVRDDLAAIARRAERDQRPVVEHAATRVYDRYLHANRVPDGVASYSRALTLILSEPIRGALKSYRQGAGGRGQRHH